MSASVKAMPPARGILVATLIVMAVAPPGMPGQTAETRPCGDERGAWIGEFVKDFEPNRQALEHIDVRNRKLFGGLYFLQDVDERGRCAEESQCQMVFDRAADLVAEAFPAVRPAFASHTAESAVNFTTHRVFIRGQDNRFDFAAVLPTGAVTGSMFSEPLLITFLPRSGEAGVGHELMNYANSAERADARVLGRILAPLGNISVENVQAAHAEKDFAEIDANGVLNGINVRGQPRVLVSANAVALELRDAESVPGPEGKAFQIQPRRTGSRVPDWVSERNLITPDEETAAPAAP